MIEPPFPDLDEMLTMIGEAGRRLSDIGASEGAAGNISVYFDWPVDPRKKFPQLQIIDLPQAVPEFGGKTMLVTGSGSRLREIILDPIGNLGCVIVEPGGLQARLYTSPNRLFSRLTSEFNSHLAVHYDQVVRSGTNFHAVVHAQPPHITYLSHIPRYQDEAYLNRRLLRWEPEMIISLPEGIGVVPFCVPGSADMMAGTLAALKKQCIVIWSKHGVVARSDVSVKRASDRIEYAETGAHYEYLNLVAGEPAVGLSDEEIRLICSSFGISQAIF
jgi:rhamnulose-1-phosphate aldolase